MARAGGLYSRVIAWLKVLLPLAALALLSTLFLPSRTREPLDSVPFAEALRQGAAALEWASSPQYTGTTSKGELVTMNARRARPLGDGDILAEEFDSHLHLLDGGIIRVRSLEAHLQDGNNLMHLYGGVLIEDAQGYELTTEAMISALDEVFAESLGPVQGKGPLGTLDAGRMRIVPAEGDGDVQIHFTGGVKLIYRPPEKDAVE
jgi:lipopolysaccharide export system protein LptC